MIEKFVMVDVPGLDDWVLMGGWSTAKVWFVLARRADRGNRVVITENDLMLSAAVSRRALFRAFAKLESLRFIVREAGVIHLNSNLLWRGRRDAMGRSRLSCPVVIPKRKKSA